jgi:glycosyltransferase involved in cell wall biosynthesis
MRYKTAFLTSSLNIGGKELILLSALRKMDAARFEPMLFVAKGDGNLVPEVTDCRIYIGAPRGNVLKSLPALWRTLTRERPDIVWCVAAGVMGFAGRLLAYILRTPVIIISLHGGEERARLMDWPNRLITRFTTDKVVTTSQAMGETLRQEGVAEHLLAVINNGIDVDRFLPPDDRATYKQSLLQIDPRRPVIGTVASLVPRKAQHVFLRAAPHVLEAHPEALFVLAGEGSSRPELEALSHQLGIEEHIRFLGLRKDIAELMRSFDVFVLTSDYEPFGNVVIEAMASGLPVVCTAVDGVPELVTDETGMLVPPGDDHAVAEAVIRLLGDPAQREAMGQAGRRRAVEHFSLETMMRKREALLLELVEKRSQKNPVK